MQFGHSGWKGFKKFHQNTKITQDYNLNLQNTIQVIWREDDGMFLMKTCVLGFFMCILTQAKKEFNLIFCSETSETSPFSELPEFDKSCVIGFVTLKWEFWNILSFEP